MSTIGEVNEIVPPTEEALHAKCLRELDRAREDFAKLKISETQLADIAENRPVDTGGSMVLALNATEIDILTKEDPVTGKRSMIEVKDMNDPWNVIDELAGKLGHFYEFDPDGGIIIYVRSGQVVFVDTELKKLFSFDFEVKPLPVA